MKRLLDETTWHGKAIKATAGAGKIVVVLFYFTGLFAIIAADSVEHRLRRRQTMKGTART